MSDALPRPMSVVSPVEPPTEQRSLSRQALSRLNSIRRDRKKFPDEPRPDSATIEDVRILEKPAKAHSGAKTNVNQKRERDRLSIYLHVNGNSPTQDMAQYWRSQGQISRFSPDNSPATEVPRQIIKPRRNCCKLPLSILRLLLRLAIVALAGAVACVVAYSVYLFGNKNINLRKGELPISWPAHTNLASAFILFGIAFVNFLLAVTMLILSARGRSGPPRRDCRVTLGFLAIALWAAGLAAYMVLSNASKASLIQYSCNHKDVVTNGKHTYQKICTNMHISFYCGIGAGALELLILITLLISARRARRSYVIGKA